VHLRHLSLALGLSAALLTPASSALADDDHAVAPLPAQDIGPTTDGSPTASTLLPPSLQTASAKDRSGPGRFTLVGHEPLSARGMNAALAVYDKHVYVGSRTDGSPGHLNPGIQVVDVQDPSKPQVVGEITEEQGGLGQTSRELRVWPQQKLLLVMNFECSALIHRCTSTGDLGSRDHAIRFYDLTDPAAPKLVSTYRTPRAPHEMHLWLDPKRPGRALLYYSTPTSSDTQPNMIVADITKARQGEFVELARWNPNTEFSDDDRDEFDVRLHSMATTADGRRTHMAYLGGGYLLADTSDFADAKPKPEVRLLTPVEKRVSWGNPGAHSAVEIPRRPNLALATDEVYGTFGGVLAEHGCPWGWTRILDIRNLMAPKVLSEYKLKENTQEFCDEQDDERTENFTSFSAHNPTVVGPDLALVTWHGKGLQAIDLRNPGKPVSGGEWMPENPLATVRTEDPALGGGNVDNIAGGTRDKVILWSFPIVYEGLIYVVDLRNGLYILRYDGELSSAVKDTAFLEGNSNVGQVLAADRTRAASRRDIA
jgi:hypothetical protein